MFWYLPSTSTSHPMENTESSRVEHRYYYLFTVFLHFNLLCNNNRYETDNTDRSTYFLYYFTFHPTSYYRVWLNLTLPCMTQSIWWSFDYISLFIPSLYEFKLTSYILSTDLVFSITLLPDLKFFKVFPLHAPNKSRFVFIKLTDLNNNYDY